MENQNHILEDMETYFNSIDFSPSSILDSTDICDSDWLQIDFDQDINLSIQTPNKTPRSSTDKVAKSKDKLSATSNRNVLKSINKVTGPLFTPSPFHGRKLFMSTDRHSKETSIKATSKVNVLKRIPSISDGTIINLMGNYTPKKENEKTDVKKCF